MVSAYEKAIKSQWKGRCTVMVRESGKDPGTNLMEPVENVTIQDEPCRLSYQSVSTAGTGVAAGSKQEIKLFIDSKLSIPPGSKIRVTQNGVTQDFERSGLPAVYSVHQEILLQSFQGWA